jgi:hypothetical protein
VDLFVYSFEADFIQGLLKKNEKKLARSFNVTFHYIDDVLSLNNYRFGDVIDHIYPIELAIKDTTDTYRSASYLDLVGEKRITVDTHRYVDCLLKHSKYVVNKKLEHVEDISFRELLVESEWLFTKSPNLPLSLRFKGSGCHYNSI